METRKQGQNYFSVFFTTEMLGVRYTPSVCYPITGNIQAAVGEMVKKNQAKIYPEQVRFVSGVAYPLTKGTASSTAGAAQEAKPRKRGRREFE
jgi:hypothetical protein